LVAPYLVVAEVTEELATMTSPQAFSFFYGNRGRVGQAVDFNPDNNNNGLWIEGTHDGESAGIFMNGNTLVLWSPGDNQLVRIYDEDSLPGGSPLFVIDGGGSVSISGNLAVAGVKQFAIDHPMDGEGRLLVHASLEGPECAVFYRGQGRIESGRAYVQLPSYFEALTRPEGRTVMLTPCCEADEPVSMLAASEIVDGAFTVRAADDRNPQQKFYWEVKAVRADVERLEIEQPKDKGSAGTRRHRAEEPRQRPSQQLSGADLATVSSAGS
jgi:hypothetical protein